MEIFIGQTVKEINTGRVGKVESLSTECGPDYVSVRFPGYMVPQQCGKENLTSVDTELTNLLVDENVYEDPSGEWHAEFLTDNNGWEKLGSSPYDSREQAMQALIKTRP